MNFMQFLSFLALVPALIKADTWGPAYSLGPTSAAIIEAVTTFNPGTPPTDAQDCGASSTQWCVSASYFGVTGQISGDLVPVDADTDIEIHYKLGSDSKTWTQTVTVDGSVISTLDTDDGPLENGGWGTGTECQSDCKGTTSTQTYTNTTITLSAADPTFSNTLGVASAITHSELYTEDGGVTWKVDSISIPPYTA